MAQQDIIDELNYLKETKQQIKQAIIDKGQDVYDETPFRDYASKIADIETGGDTHNATAREDDVLAPKTFYAGNKKRTGRIQPEYATGTGTIKNTIDLDIQNAICDYRPDIGFYIKLNGNLIEVYNIDTNELIMTYNSNSVLNTDTDGSGRILKIYNCKFSQNVITGNTYNIIYNMSSYASGMGYYRNGIGVIRFDKDNPTDTNFIYFKYCYQDGYRYNISNRNFGAGLVEKNNYVYSTCQSHSNYYEHDSGYTRYFYINNETKTITMLWQYRVQEVSGSIPYMTDNGRMITVFVNASTANVLTVNEARTGISAVGITISSDRHRPITLDDGIIYDYKYYTTNGVVHTFDKSNWPFNYNDTILYSNGFLLRFNGSTLYTYRFNKETFEIIKEKAYMLDGVPTISYYGDNGVLNSSNYPILSSDSKYIMFVDNLNNKYITQYLSGEPDLVGVNIGGEKFTNLSTVTTTADKLLAGSYMYNYNGKVLGTMPNNGQLSYIPTMENQVIPSGYTSGGVISGVTSDVDENIIASNIKKDITILGVTGTYEPTGGDATSDGSLQAKYLLEGYSAVVDGKWVNGTMKNYGTRTFTPTSDDIEIPEGHYDSISIPQLNAANCEDYTLCSQAITSI